MLESSDWVGKYYDRFTDSYLDRGIYAMQSALFDADLDRHLDIAFARVAPTPGSTILDAGCGVGIMSFGFALRDPTLRVLAVTVSAYQAQFAEREADRLGIADRVKVMCCSYQQIPVQDAQFSLAMYWESLGYADMDPTFAEARRVLAPGGRVYVRDIAQVDDPSIAQSITLAGSRADWRYSFASIDQIELAAMRAGFVTDRAVRNMNELLPHGQMHQLAGTDLGGFHRFGPEHAHALKMIELVMRAPYLQTATGEPLHMPPLEAGIAPTPLKTLPLMTTK